jgi:hypothetical protein
VTPPELSTSPALEFIAKRLEKNVRELWLAPLEGSLWADRNKSAQLLIDLIFSDIPLDSGARLLIADQLRRLCFPDPVQDRYVKQQREALKFKTARRHLRSQGLTAEQADSVIAEGHNVTVDAVRKKIYRARRATKKRLSKK